MLDELTKRQRDLGDIAQRFQQFRTFAAAIRQATRGKPFTIRNLFAWQSIISMRHMIVIDLAAWVDSLHDKWLLHHLQGEHLARLRTSKRLAAKLAEQSPVIVVGQHESEEDRNFTAGLIRGHLQQTIVTGRRQALHRLFGVAAAKRGSARADDIQRLSCRLREWATNLRDLRNELAHRYGSQPVTAKVLRPHDLARRFKYCARLMNDLRLLIDHSTYHAPSVEVGAIRNLPLRDMVDLIVTGPIQEAAAEWQKETGEHPWQRRDAYYRRLHRQRRAGKGASFN